MFFFISYCKVAISILYISQYYVHTLKVIYLALNKKKKEQNYKDLQNRIYFNFIIKLDKPKY